MPDFSSPQRQSKIGIVVMFAHTLQEWGRALFPILIVAAVNVNSRKTAIVIGIMVLLLLVAIVVGWLRYRNFTFWIDEANEEFVITEGILNKSKTVVQLHKIQQVNINQSLLQRIIGVYALEVDTAGSNKKEGKIRAISHGLALALKERLLDNSRRKIQSEPFENVIDGAISEVASEAKPFIRISFLSLFKYGITSNYLRTTGVLFAFFWTAYENVHRALGNTTYDPNLENYFQESIALQTGLILVGLLLLSILVINVVRVMLRYFNYSISRQKGSLLLSFGLINTKSTIIKPEKVQMTTVSQNYFQKKMDILELRIRQATSGHNEQKNTAIEIPGVSSGENDKILDLLFGTIPQKGIMLKPNYRKLVFSIFLSIVVPLSIAYFALPDEILRDFAWVFPTWTILRATLLYFGFRHYRLFIHDKFVIKQSGAWDIANQIITPEKIQALSVSQLFWHKSADIGYLTIYTAGGKLSFQLGNYTVVKAYVNKWLYEMETSDSNWM